MKRFLRRLRRWSWFALAGFVLVSVLGVGAWRWFPPPTSAVMLQHAWAEGAWPEYRWVALGAVAPEMALAVVAAEDQKFPEHAGFDVEAIAEAVEDYLDGGRLRGASTLTQQVARNLFLWQGRSLVRKGLEAWFTAWLELLWPKRRILEVYLNIAETGPGTFGVEAAAVRYFGRPAAELDARQAALLAAVLPNPVRYRADRPSAYVLGRRDWILRQMSQLGGTAYLDRLR